MPVFNSHRVAVLLAAYNGMEFISQQLQTIFNQSNVQLGIFISVDVSSDATYEWCKELERSCENLTVLEYGERYGGAAKNFFRLLCDVDFKDYEYVALSDQDDLWHLDKLSHGINQMKVANADAYSGNVTAFWDDGREKFIDKAQPQKELDYLFEAAGPGCTYIFTQQAASLIKQYLKEFPGLNDFVLHDWLAYAILRHNDYEWFIDSEPKMMYRQHDTNQVGANTSVQGMIYRMNYILSGQVFESVALLLGNLGISSIQISSRMGVLRLALKARQLRRRGVDQFFAFMALIFYAIKGPKA